jgi:SAM-dependent methyltransferase
VLIEPVTERLLDVVAGDTILDAACGAGRFTRRMAELGTRVVAFDYTEEFIARARERTSRNAAVEYRVVDAASAEALLSVGSNRLNKAVCTMAIRISRRSPRKTEGIIGQPQPQWFFHRPINTLFRFGFETQAARLIGCVTPRFIYEPRPFPSREPRRGCSAYCSFLRGTHTRTVEGWTDGAESIPSTAWSTSPGH